MSDKASLSDIEFARQVGRFRRQTVAISAAVGYDSGDDSRRSRPLRTARAPAWARLSGSFRENSEAEALFFAGAALVRPRFRRQFRPAVGRRLAPPPGAEKRRRGRANLLNRREDEAALRDAVALAKPGQELGPAGRVYSAFRTLAGPGDPLRPVRLAAVAADLQAPLDPQKAAELAAALGEAGARGRPAPVVAAAAAAAVTALRPTPSRSRFRRRRRAGQGLGWPTPLPLLASELFERRATGEGRRPRPGEAGWMKLVALELRTRGARRPRPGPGPVAPRGPAHGRRAKTARQGEGGRDRGPACRRRRFRRGAHRGLERPRPPTRCSTAWSRLAPRASSPAARLPALRA